VDHVQTFSQLLADYAGDRLVQQVSAQLGTPADPRLVDKLAPLALDLGYCAGRVDDALSLLNACAGAPDRRIEILRHINRLQAHVGRYTEACQTAAVLQARATSDTEHLVASHYRILSLIEAGAWHEVDALLPPHYALLDSVLYDPDAPRCLTPWAHAAIDMIYLLPYLADDPVRHRPLQSRLAEVFSSRFRPWSPSLDAASWNPKDRRARIGYLGSGLRRHSVGWLLRWTLEQHDRDRFVVFAYLIGHAPDQFTRAWIEPNVDHLFCGGNDVDRVYRRIRDDELDLLIDLDSATLDLSCEIMARRAAPRQASWLGWDASGVACVDYYLAGPGQIPTEDHPLYREQILTLPGSLIAVKGFEAGEPTWSRSRLNIPEWSTIYLSVQSGMKREAAHLRRQLQIVARVPDSVLLLKGLAGDDLLRRAVVASASATGLSLDRIRFLPRDPDESTHRANLALADIVLDTYPYNGATTSLEALWAGIPLVTRAGRQLAARTSLSFLESLGLHDCVAYSEQQFVDLGVRLGLDRTFRREISDRLRSARGRADLWYPEGFTRRLESVYLELLQLPQPCPPVR
jgi:predicted O-linked N-acetylglucosamine transferase (SPINDLY family)